MKKNILIIIFLLLCAGLVLFYLAWQQLKKSEEAAFLSCLASIATDLDKYNATARPLVLKETAEWELLEASQAQNLLHSIRRHDCKGGNISELKDPWGNTILIAYKHNSLGTVFLAWTQGKDGISGNEDDLVYPIGAKTLK